MEKVSIIIPSFNRFYYLLNTLKSIKNQTYQNYEIIVINDGSNQKEYLRYDWEKNNIIIIHLLENTKKFLGLSSPNYVRKKGIEKSTGDFIAFCDDDDIWFPQKLELQINAMKKTGCKMSCSDGLIGGGIYEKNRHYLKYNAENYNEIIKNIFTQKGAYIFFENGFPRIWTLEFLKIHNCVVISSVIVSKQILNENISLIDHDEFNKEGNNFYPVWLKILENTSCVYIDNVLFYYDNYHGDNSY